jgi:hypothetical protein
MTNPPPYPGMSAGRPEQPYSGTPAATGKSSTTRTVLIIVGVMLALCVFGGVVAAAIGDSNDTPRPIAAQDQANRQAASSPTSPAATATSSPAAAPTTTAAAKPTKVKPEPVRIGEGSYRVGEDIPAGRYKAVERADAECYWSREKGTAIIDNNIGGGFPQFTTRKGEDVTIGYGCPEFERLDK